MKKMKKIYWMLFIILCAACNDPYDGDTYVVFDMQPAGTYLSNGVNERRFICPTGQTTFPNGFTL